jgi:HEAT repeat protein
MRLNKLTSRLTIISIPVLFVIASRSQQPVPLELPVPLVQPIPVVQPMSADTSGLHGTPEQFFEQHHIALDEPTVMSALRSNNGEVRVMAAELVGQDWPKDAVPAIEEALQKENDIRNRINMATDLARLGDALGRETLRSVCHTASEWGSVRMSAAFALSTEFQDDSCLDLVFDVLQKDSDPKDTSAKEQALEVTPDLIGRLSRPQSQKLFDLLAKALGDPWPGVRITASVTLGRLGDVAAIPRLQAAIANEKDEGCRSAMAGELKSLQIKKGTH